MGLLDLFRPKWKNSDAAVRLEAVKSLISEDLPILTQVLRHDRDVRVRRAALKKVQDAELLSELADKDPDEGLRRDAADKAGELWLEAVLDPEDEALATQAVERLIGQRALIEAACRAKFPAVRQAALGGIKDDRGRAEIARRSDDTALRSAAAAAIKDAEALRDLISSDGNRELLLSLLERVRDAASLEYIVRKAKVKAVAKAARERLDAARPQGAASPAAAKSAAGQAAQGTKTGAPVTAAVSSPREELCRRLETAAKTQDFEDAEGFLASLRAEWQALGVLSSSDALQKRFERAAARYQERRDAFLKKLQKQKGPQPVVKAAPVAVHVAPAAPAQPSPAELKRREEEAKRKREEEERRAEAQKERAEEQQRLDAQRALREAERKVRQAEQDEKLRADEEKRAAEQKARDEKQQQNLTRALAECDKLEQLAGTEELSLKKAEQALKQAHEVMVAANPLPRAEGQKARSRYDEARAKLVIRLHDLREREDWLRFSNVPKLEVLVQHAETLLGAAGHEDADHTKVAAALKTLQAEWKTVGPAPKDKSEALWARFKSLCDQIYERTKTASDEERQGNLRRKEALCGQIEGIVQSLGPNAAEIASQGGQVEAPDWRVVSESVKKLQAEWKSVGPAPGAAREQSEALWGRFKAAADAFFDKRKGHYAELDEDRQQNQRKKEELCIRVERLLIAPVGADMKAAAEQIKRYQADWKEIGPAPKEQNDELWQRFRKACDGFFEKRKAAFEKQEGERLGNQKKKEALCEKAEELARREDANQDSVESELKQLQAEWKRIGPAPREVQEELWQRFRKAADAVFGRGREPIELPPESGAKFANKLPLAGLLAQMQAGSEPPESTAAADGEGDGVEAGGADSEGAASAGEAGGVVSESATSPSSISGSWIEAANSGWGEIDEHISSGLTPKPEEESAERKPN